MKKTAEKKVKETEEEKQARWAKNRKLAKSIAKMSGINTRAIANERSRSNKSSFIDY